MSHLFSSCFSHCCDKIPNRSNKIPNRSNKIPIEGGTGSFRLVIGRESTAEFVTLRRCYITHLDRSGNTTCTQTRGSYKLQGPPLEAHFYHLGPTLEGFITSQMELQLKYSSISTLWTREHADPCQNKSMVILGLLPDVSHLYTTNDSTFALAFFLI